MGIAVLPGRRRFPVDGVVARSARQLYVNSYDLVSREDAVES